MILSLGFSDSDSCRNKSTIITIIKLKTHGALKVFFFSDPWWSSFAPVAAVAAVAAALVDP